MIDNIKFIIKNKHSFVQKCPKSSDVFRLKKKTPCLLNFDILILKILHSMALHFPQLNFKPPPQFTIHPLEHICFSHSFTTTHKSRHLHRHHFLNAYLKQLCIYYNKEPKYMNYLYRAIGINFTECFSFIQSCGKKTWLLIQWRLVTA